MMIKTLALAGMLFLATPALAEEPANLDAPMFSAPPAATDNNAPVEITADKTLEWHKDTLQYVARVNAMVKRGATTIKADTITADYRADKKSGNSIYRMTGSGHVSIDDTGNVVTGDNLVYDMDTGLATMTGNNLALTSPEQTVTARDKFEYYANQGQIKAIGDAKLVRGNDTLYGDTLTAYLADDGQGKKSLDRMDAAGNVKIITPNETLTGNKANYIAKTDTAIVTGKVKITREKNVLTGERAEVNLGTNVSRLFGSSIEDGQTGGRVRGVFYPSSQKKADKAENGNSVFTTISAEPAPPVQPPVPVITTTPAPGAEPAAPVTAPTPAPVENMEKAVTEKGKIITEHRQKAATPN
ncbi:MAG: ostA-like family protein [Micavibrio sp.]|nr:ostA-like family protein [Micavibrio sp.]